jgi:hypothetical protein
MGKLEGMESPEDSPVPLAWDSSGAPFDPPRGASLWRVRRVLPKGGLAVVKDGPSRPLFLKITATEDDAIAALTELRQPNGRYRLDPVDSQGRDCGAIHTIFEYRRPLDADDAGEESEEGAGPSKPEGGDTDKVIIDSLLGTIKELAQANAATSARIGEALAVNAHNSSNDKMSGFVEGFARLVSLAHDSATPREILVQQPNDEAAARTSAGGQGGALDAMLPHLAPVVASKAGALVDAFIARMRQPSSPPPPAWPRNGFPSLPQLPVPWPPPPDLPVPDLRFAAASSSSSSAPANAEASATTPSESEPAAASSSQPSSGGAS